MTFDAFYLFVAVYAVEGTVITLMDALAVHDANACFSILTFAGTDFLTQVIQQQIKFTQGSPFAIIILNQLPGSEMRGEHTPLTAGLHEIENGVPYLTQVIFSYSLLHIQDFLDNLPLCFF